MGRTSPSPIWQRSRSQELCLLQLRQQKWYWEAAQLPCDHQREQSRWGQSWLLDRALASRRFLARCSTSSSSGWELRGEPLASQAQRNSLCLGNWPATKRCTRWSKPCTLWGRHLPILRVLAVSYPWLAKVWVYLCLSLCSWLSRRSLKVTFDIELRPGFGPSLFGRASLGLVVIFEQVLAGRLPVEVSRSFSLPSRWICVAVLWCREQHCDLWSGLWPTDVYLQLLQR